MNWSQTDTDIVPPWLGECDARRGYKPIDKLVKNSSAQGHCSPIAYSRLAGRIVRMPDGRGLDSLLLYEMLETHKFISMNPIYQDKSWQKVFWSEVVAY